jgi:hypothetical protein
VERLIQGRKSLRILGGRFVKITLAALAPPLSRRLRATPNIRRLCVNEYEEWRFASSQKSLFRAPPAPSGAAHCGNY